MNKMKSFHDHVRKINKGRISWIVIWITAMTGMPLCGRGTGEDLSGFLTICNIILIFIASMDYVDKYIQIDQPDDDSSLIASLMSGMSGRFDVMMRCHSFDTGAYFKIMMIRMIPVQLITVVYLAVLKLADLIASDVVLYPALAVIILPVIVILLRGVVLQHKLMNDTGSVMIILRGVVATLYGTARLLIYAIIFIISMFLIPAVIGHDRLMGGIADNEVACSAISAGPSFILMIIGAMILCYMIVNGLGGGKKRRKMRIAALIASVVLILSGGGILFYQSLYNNVILRPDSITVNRNGSYTEYTLDEVQSFRIYASADDSLQMELNFKDGKSQKLFLGAAENTTAWSERYFSDYNYAAELAGKLAERGVSGSLDNKAALRRTVSTLDAQCAEGMDIIEQIVDSD